MAKGSQAPELDFSRTVAPRTRARIVRAQDVGLYGADDPDVLAWASRDNRILLTHDGATMPDFAYERVDAGEQMPGVFIVSDRLSVGQ